MSVYLIARNHILTWPIGLVAVVLFAILFYQIRLYGDFVEQVYYFGACLYGWWLWLRNQRAEISQFEVKWSNPLSLFTAFILVGIGSYFASLLLSNLDQLFPKLFPEPASLPTIDAFTTIASFMAMILMAHKRLESWIYWIVINLISVWLYWYKGVLFISFLYLIFLGLAIYGLGSWLKIRRHSISFGR